jgi:NADH:ubiquinone oxidoreductase subunit 3 (subunit A)
LSVIQTLLSNVSLLRDPQITSLESGFENLSHAIIISSSFFILAVLFVLFDIELIILIPGILSFCDFSRKMFILFLCILIVVFLTLIVEWA